MKGWILFFRTQDELKPEDYSVRRMLEAAESKGIDLKIIAPPQCELIVNRTDNRSILIDGVSTELPDFVIPRMGSQTTYFALSVLRQLEYLGVHIVNPPSTIERVSDKLYMCQLLARSELPTPKTMLAKPSIDWHIVEKEIGYPVVIKTLSGTAGRGVHLCETPDTLRDVMDLIYSSSPTANIIFQEFIKSSRGHDLRVFVLGGRVIGCMKRISGEGFKANVSLGGTVEPYPLTKEIEWLAIEVCRLLNLEIAGVDLLFTENGFTICEANSSPGFIGMEKVTGPIIAEEIMDYIKVRFQQT